MSYQNYVEFDLIIVESTCGLRWWFGQHSLDHVVVIGYKANSVSTVAAVVACAARINGLTVFIKAGARAPVNASTPHVCWRPLN